MTYIYHIAFTLEEVIGKNGISFIQNAKVVIQSDPDDINHVVISSYGDYRKNTKCNINNLKIGEK
jgi:hypothetical protein